MTFRKLTNLIYILFSKSDAKRWSNLDNHDESWSGRTLAMSKYIQPGERVFEFGAGRCHLRDMLPAECEYTPSDIVDRGQETFVCDLNARPLPSFPDADVAVCSGVLEYVHDLDSVIAALAKSFPRIIVSYADVDRNPKISKRVRNGWFNHLNRRKFVGAFQNAGYRLDKEAEWMRHGIYVFVLEKHS